MNYLAGIMLLLIAYIVWPLPSNMYKDPPEFVLEVYKDLLSKNHIQIYVPVYIIESYRIQGYSQHNRIVLTTGMLRYIQNKDELASVLAHELSHIVLHHTKSTPKNELYADQQGAYYMKNAGYNICRGFRVILRFNDPWSSTHPSSVYRYQHVGCHRMI